MKYICCMLILVLFFPAIIYAGTCSTAGGCSGVGPTWTSASVSWADVNQCLSCSTYGDTIVIPAGSATWSSQLDVTKYRTLQGAGYANTIIKSGMTNSAYALIKYQPDATSRSANSNAGGLFRVTGITFDGDSSGETDSTSQGIWIYGTHTDKYYYNIRIDNNKFQYFRWVDSSYATEHSCSIKADGLFFGVIDNNQFVDTYPGNLTGNWTYSWYLTQGFTLGSLASWFVEDNTFLRQTRHLTTGGGGTMVVRFNTFDNPVYRFPIIGIHGNGDNSVFWPYDTSKSEHRGQVYSEVYKNKITNLAGSGWYSYVRGGTNVVWGNELYNYGSYSMNIQLREEDCENDRCPSVVLRSGIYYECKQNHVSSASNGPPNATYWKTSPGQTAVYSTWGSDSRSYCYDEAYDQLKNNYYWGNLRGTSKINTPSLTGTGETPYSVSFFLTANADYWLEGSSFVGTSGIWSGTAAEMAAADVSYALTNGVGWWVTDEGTWNQSGGDNCLSYNGQGQFYRAASDTWVLYYTPYTYPHPLRGGTPPTAQDITIDGNNCTSLVQLQCTDSTWPIDTKTMAVSTGVPGTCKYDTSNASYSSMSNTFSTTGGTSHSQSLAVDCGSSYSYYVKCGDSDTGVNCLFAVDKDPPPRKTYNITELKLWKSPL